MFAVCLHIGDAGVVVTLDAQRALGFGLDQAAYAFGNFVHVDRAQGWRAVGAEHAVDQITQAVGFFDDDVGVVFQRLIRQLAGQQLGRTANPAQRVFDLMGQAAHQYLGDFLLGQLGFFLGDAQQAITRVKLNQQPVAFGGNDRGDRVIHHQALAVVQRQLSLTFGKGVAVFDGVMQRFQCCSRIAEEVGDRLLMHPLATDRQQHFRGRVHKAQAQLAIEQQYGGGQVIENLA